MIDVAISGEKHVIKKETERAYSDVTIEIQRKWKANKKSDASNYWGNWNQLQITQTVLKRHNEKGEIKELLKNSPTGHYTHTAEKTDVKVRNIQHGGEKKHYL